VRGEKVRGEKVKGGKDEVRVEDEMI